MAQHQPEWAGVSLGRGCFLTIHLQLQIFCGTGGFGAIQTWRLPRGSWGVGGGPDTELRASMVRAVYSLSGRPSAEGRTGSSTEDGWRANNRLTFSHNSLEVESEENGVPDFQLSQKH